jgi:hypothetical protein
VATPGGPLMTTQLARQVPAALPQVLHSPLHHDNMYATMQQVLANQRVKHPRSPATVQ